MRTSLLLLLVISLCTLIFLLLSYISPLYPSATKNTSLSPQSAKLYFEPSTIISTCNNASASATIFIESNSAPISSAQIELQYNPNLLYDFSLTPADNNFFGEYEEYMAPIQDVRDEYGRASLVIIAQNDLKSGNKPVARIDFSINPQIASQSTQVRFLNKSSILPENSRSSILQEMVPLTILCQSN